MIRPYSPIQSTYVGNLPTTKVCLSDQLNFTLFSRGLQMMQNYLEEVGRTSPCTSLVPRPLPDFISQPWRKSGEGLGSLLRHRPDMDLVST